MRLLVLFDVDGTLLLTHDEVYVEANRDALQAVWGMAPPGTDAPGETATAHTRRTLRAAGLDDGTIDAGLDEWCRLFSARYVTLLADADTVHWRSPAEAADVLASIERPALLTGNPEPIARARMQRLRLARFFSAGQGAFGCERDRRSELLALARERAGNWPAARTVTVGDTPLDIATANAGGARCVAVTTGSYDAAQLGDADVVIGELAELPGALAMLD